MTKILRVPCARSAVFAAITLFSWAAALSAFTYTVTSTNDSGLGSLRQAILYSNTYAGEDLIVFDIPGPGVHTISPTSELPHITDWVTIDGYTQPGTSPNALVTSDDAVLRIEINGEFSGDSDGLVVTVGGVTIRGLVINRFRRNVVLGYYNSLEGCFIGTDPTGTVARSRNVAQGVEALYSTIGGPLPPQRNVISGNNGAGIAATGGDIQGNFIGIDATGTVSLPNAINVDAVSSTIGGRAAPAGAPPGNVISGSSSYGIRLTGSEPVSIRGNLIGTNAVGTGAIPNGSHGILVWRDCATPPGCAGAADFTVIGGPDPADGNVVAFNLGDGIATAPESPGSLHSLTLSSNAIHSNTGLGIDLNDDGVTPNAVGNPGNSPIFTTAASSGGSTVILGTLNHRPNEAGIRVDIFSSSECDASGHGEGATRIGSTVVHADAAGNAAFSIVLPVSLEPGSVVTGTAAKGWITSEFSACRTVIDVLPTLQILGISPHSGIAVGGTPVTVEGTGFGPGTLLTIGGIPAGDVIVIDSSTITATTPALLPGTLNHVSVANPGGVPESALESATLGDGWMADFLDVPQEDIFHPHVEKILRAGITAGCGGGNYCRNSAVRKDQMAVFLLKGTHGPTYVPPACWFVPDDVACPGPFADWIAQSMAEGIMFLCDSANFCPGDPVLRDIMARHLLGAEHGAAYTPPLCTPPGRFLDAACPGSFTDWIEQLAEEGITVGCGGGNYCPYDSITRGQIAVFLTKTFYLP